MNVDTKCDKFIVECSTVNWVQHLINFSNPTKMNTINICCQNRSCLIRIRSIFVINAIIVNVNPILPNKLFSSKSNNNPIENPDSIPIVFGKNITQ